MIVKRGIYAFLIAVLMSAGATQVQAQSQPYRGSFRSVRQLILRIDNRTNLLRNSINRQSQNRVYNTTGENVQTLVGELERTIDNLRDRFNRRASTSNDAQDVLNAAARLEPLAGRELRGSGVMGHWNALRNDLNQLANAYGLSWPSVSQTYPNTYPSPVGSTVTSLTGTYRLDPSRSDDPGRMADQATQSVPYRDRARLRDQVAARLESPDQIAIDVRGREVTLASTRAPQITFVADGTERIESSGTGRSIRARASLVGDQLVVSSTGDAGNQFNVTFDPIDNGRTLSVTRRVYVIGLARPVVVQSIYQRTSDVARFDINTGPQSFPTNTSTSTGDFIVPNGERLVAVLNDSLSTETARDGDRFTATVRGPSQFEGAVIEGHVSAIQRSGRVTGRSQMTLSLDTIRLRDGRSYRFAGILESVRTVTGETVKLDNEGAVREDSQTNRTVQRTAIGTAVGAIIGAIAGGGKGAAIGAILGAGGGAGSVYVQGRDDLDLQAGSELTIQATGPR
jgi:hypothetical protein